LGAGTPGSYGSHTEQRFGIALPQTPGLSFEIISALEIVVHGGVPHIRDFIQGAQPFKNHQPQVPRLDHTATQSLQFRFDVVNQTIDVPVGNGPACASHSDPGHQFVAVEFLPPAIALFNQQHRQLDLFVRGEPSPAGQAFPSAANAVLGIPRIGNFALRGFAVWTFHRVENLLVGFSNYF
jgi:hypothetical protein